VHRYAKCPSILIDGSGAAAPELFEGGVVEQLDKVLRTQIGSALLGTIHNDGVLRCREVWLVPHAARLDSRGTTPGRCLVVWDGRGTDDHLVHELVHALRRIRGKFQRIHTSRHDNEEEFFATLVSNIYRSERNNEHRRGNHSDRALSGTPSNSSEEFLGKGAAPPSRAQLENRRLVHKFVCENWGLCNSICWNVTADFNPIREYLDDPGLYLHYSFTVCAAGKNGRGNGGGEVGLQTGQKPVRGIQLG
jgi:hypothetical protein